MVELVVVILMLGILAVVVIPRLTNVSLADRAFFDQAVSALRFAQKTAVSHRRLVCAGVAATTVSLTIANANPATTCNSVIAGPDGAVSFASSSDAANANIAAVTVNGAVQALPLTLYFQPSGTVTAAGAGGDGDTFILTTTGMGAITVAGATGYVR